MDVVVVVVVVVYGYCGQPGCVIRYDTRCYFNVRSKADISPLNLPHVCLCVCRHQRVCAYA